MSLSILLLLAVELVLIFANVTPDTWLLGWDNTVPELNFPLNFSRSFYGVWLEYRGLGLYDGMSHIANLVHTIFLWALSLIVPTNLLRYTFTFLMHFVGGLGMYTLLKEFIPNKTVRLLGALFYLLNPATIQMFYTPLEAFSVHFAGLPWLALSLIQYLAHGSKKSLIFFLVVAFLSTPQYFVPTLLLPVGILLATTALFYKGRRIAIAAIGFILINAFWLLPYIYGLPQNASIISQAKINQMSSSEAFSRNQAFGDPVSVLHFKGYALDFTDLMADGTVTSILDVWKGHFNSPGGMTTSWIIAGIIVFGLIRGFSKRSILPFVLVYIASFFILANDTPIIEGGITFLRTQIPILGEALRFPFTKFSLLFALSSSVLLAYGISLIIKWRLLPFLIVVPILYLALPAFTGNFLYSNLKVRIPDEYSHMSQMLNTLDPYGRVALLPQYEFWSWKHYRWGYHGSGFSWFGIAEPTMDRAFDPWSRQNENYYWELSYALYSKDPESLEAVFDKYDIGFILLDENIISSSHNRTLYTDEIKQLINEIPTINLLATFGKLKLYERTNEETKEFVTIQDSLPRVTPAYTWTDNDVAFRELGDYVIGENGYSYPNRSLFTKRSIDERDFTLRQARDLVYDSSQTADLNSSKATSCGLVQSGRTAVMTKEDYLHFETLNQKVCLSFGIPTLTHTEGYLVQVESRNIAGRSLLFALINQTAKHVETEAYLPQSNEWKTTSFILPPLASDGLGYTVYLSNDSIGRHDTINDIKSIRFYRIPYQELVRERSGENKTASTTIEPIRVDHPNPAFYRVQVDAPSGSTLVLSQAFDPGWISWPKSDHVLVNNWANGWTLREQTTNNKQPTTIFIFFLPQLLEFAGFALLPLPFLWVTCYRKEI